MKWVIGILLTTIVVGLTGCATDGDLFEQEQEVSFETPTPAPPVVLGQRGMFMCQACDSSYEATIPNESVKKVVLKCTHCGNVTTMHRR